jgi:diguanylate cyclase (GGDEF) domain
MSIVLYRDILTGALIVSASLLGALVFYTLKYRNAPGVLWFSLLMTAMMVHTIGYAFELHSDTLNDMLSCVKIEYLGASFYPSLIFIFAGKYTDEHKIANRYAIIAFVIMDMITLLMVLTNSYHHLYYAAVEVAQTPGFPVFKITKGLWYYIQIAKTYISTLYCLILMIKKISNSSGIYKKKLLIAIVGTLIPLSATLIYMLGFGPANIDILPFSFFYLSAITIYGLMRYDVLHLSPVTYETVFNSIEEAVLVTDDSGALLQFNSASKRFFPSLATARTGDIITNVKEFYGCDLSPGKRICELEGRSYNFTINKIKNNAAIYVAGDITESEQTKKRLRELASYDSLTGIHNRRWFLEKLDKYNEGVFAIFDLDQFKSVNDTYGHVEGDRVLRYFGQQLEGIFGEMLTCRYGGEEFALFVPEGDLTRIYKNIEKLREKISQSDMSIKITFSAGMALYTRKRSVESILAADKKLYEAKECGRNLTLY